MAMGNGLRIAISGKGGVGKTTLSSLLAHLYAGEGKTVLAVDADPDANLGMALGFSPEGLAKITTISKDKELIKERTGADPGSMGQFFFLNPKVDDIPDKYVVQEQGIKLMVLGGVEQGGGGCICPESTLIRQLLNHLVLDRHETLIIDLEAGLEHLGRGTSGGVDVFIVVVEPGQRSIHTAHNIVRLAKDLGINKVFAVVNKCQPELEDRVAAALAPIPVLGYLPYRQELVLSDLESANAFSQGILSQEIVTIKENLEKLVGRNL